APEDAAQLGLNGGELLFKLPASIPEGETFGAGIPIDLSELPTGLYTVVLEYGLFRQDAAGKFTTGRFFTRTEPYAVVNHSESAFGAGWGLAGLFELHLGDGGALLVDGAGKAEIFLAPE